MMMVLMMKRGRRGETSGIPQNRTSQTAPQSPQKVLKESEWGKMVRSGESLAFPKWI